MCLLEVYADKPKSLWSTIYLRSCSLRYAFLPEKTKESVGHMFILMSIEGSTNYSNTWKIDITRQLAYLQMEIKLNLLAIKIQKNCR